MLGQLSMGATRRLNRHYQSGEKYNLHYVFNGFDFSQGATVLNDLKYGILTGTQKLVYPDKKHITAVKIHYELPENCVIVSYKAIGGGQGFHIYLSDGRFALQNIVLADKYLVTLSGSLETPIKPKQQPVVYQTQYTTAYMLPPTYTGKAKANIVLSDTWQYIQAYASGIYVMIADNDIYRQPNPLEGETIASNTIITVDLYVG